LVEGAKKAVGVAVIIDVFRAYSVECYLMQNGTQRLYPVADMQVAYDFKKDHPDAILVGERKGVILPGFDYGNCPADLEKVDFTGKTIVHTTSAGTQGIINAKNADVILGGCLLNAPAIAKYIKEQGFSDVSLVCMGLMAQRHTEEDTLCAEYIKSLLEEKPFDLQSGIEGLKTTSGAKFFDPAQQNVFPKRDFELCTQPGKFDFVLRVEKDPDNGMDRIYKIDMNK